MRFCAPLSASIMLVTQVSAFGVCYDPDHSALNGAMTAATVTEDLKIIKQHGFNSVRTYISKFGDTNLGLLIDDANLTSALGVPYPQDDYLEQVDAAVKAANTGCVSYIFVGNENLADATSVPQDMIATIQSIKSLVPDHVKVGTVQRNTEVLHHSYIHGWSELISVCDVLGVNIHPYFTPGTTAHNAIDVVKSQWTAMVKNFGDKLLITETGWPSEGGLSGTIGSPAGLQTFYSDYKTWSSSLDECFYFQMFDTPYKSSPYEKTFGLLAADAVDKFDFASVMHFASNAIPNAAKMVDSILSGL
ncbi:glycoside hydrolase family 17-like protein [Plasmopara halstedii]|uniref:glucan endo-1,3-beta-D-glucosidase n=1 Tax=Plasmopara halstedii TaxID=4781 RepID=A0A0P1A5H0_PLAHL|nr:glycoside hydrolase family 17-like protein [Plasmopara halstedii]CEG35366.1 glycoside hydrolase family 17-like protein [Plasmopara halstedii]|eukprot:XP_024571735.1 glycoside hydrolase family 17-like protein [Plasmopara halstedii]